MKPTIFLGALIAAVSTLACAVYWRHSLRLLYHEYSAPSAAECLSHGSTALSGKRVAICEYWTTGDGEFVHAYVYDETGQIMLSKHRRHNDWNKVVRALAVGRPYSMFSKMDGNVSQIGEDLYLIDFDYYNIPVN
jgi:hypothetical protein